MKIGDLVRHKNTEVECGETGIVLKVDSEKSYGGEVEVLWCFLNTSRWYFKQDIEVINEEG